MMIDDFHDDNHLVHLRAFLGGDEEKTTTEPRETLYSPRFPD